MFIDFTNDSCRRPSHQCIRRNIFCDDGPGRYHGVFSNGVAADNGCVGADTSPMFHQSFLIASRTFGKFSPRSQIISKYAGGPAEDSIFQFYSFIYRNIILYLYMITDPDIVGDVDILARDRYKVSQFVIQNVSLK